MGAPMGKNTLILRHAFANDARTIPLMSALSILCFCLVDLHASSKRRKSIFSKESFANPNEDPKVIQSLSQKEKANEVVYTTPTDNNFAVRIRPLHRVSVSAGIQQHPPRPRP